MKGKEKKRRGQMGRKEDLEKRKRGGKERKRTQTNPYSNSISTFRVKTELVNGRILGLGKILNFGFSYQVMQGSHFY